MGRSRKGPFAVGLRVRHLGQGRFDRREEEGTPAQSGHKDGYNAGVGLGHSPAILRGSPHFQAAPMVVIFALWDEGGGVQAREICDDGKMDVVLLLAVALQRKGVADWKFGVSMQNPRGQSHRGIPRSSCRRALQRDRNTRGLRQLILGALGHQYL